VPAFAAAALFAAVFFGAVLPGASSACFRGGGSFALGEDLLAGFCRACGFGAMFFATSAGVTGGSAATGGAGSAGAGAGSARGAGGAAVGAGAGAGAVARDRRGRRATTAPAAGAATPAAPWSTCLATDLPTFNVLMIFGRVLLTSGASWWSVGLSRSQARRHKGRGST
jgi:hypothetical protein